MIGEIITLGLFLTGLGLCIFTGIQILYALVFGLACFSVYTLSKGYSVRETCGMLIEGMGKEKNILFIFLLIGSLTSIWRTCGTIPFILYHAMGLICMLISNAAGLNPALTGGAILSGSFFGDRCSPMSTSAQLVCTLTRTDIYINIKHMFRTCLIPMAARCATHYIPAGRIWPWPWKIR